MTGDKGNRSLPGLPGKPNSPTSLICQVNATYSTAQNGEAWEDSFVWVIASRSSMLAGQKMMSR